MIIRILTLISLFFLSACLSDADKNFLWVDAVIDGDTFIARGERYRLWGVDAPEEGEKFYHTSRLYLEGLILDEELECNFIETGRYNRDVVRCYLGSKDLSALIVRQGMAKDEASFSKNYYERDEVDAQKHKRGIWKN